MASQAVVERSAITESSRSPRVDQAAIVDALVNRAVAAQRQIESWSEERIDRLLRALGESVAERAQALAAATVEETGIGNIHDKTLKIAVAGLGVAAELEGKVGYGEISFDSDRQIAEIASPVGVVVGLIPATHPVATFIFKALIAIKARNAIILSPSRRAQRVSQQVGVMIQRVLHEMGAPVALVQWTAEENTRETTTALMSHKQVGMVLATGGRAMVEAAYRSGKPAIGVGPGNAPALIAADADLPHVARSVVQSKSFDNGLVCGAENHLVVDASVRPAFISALEGRGAAVLTESEAARFLVAAVDRETHRFKRPVIGQDASTLAEWAHIERPYTIQLLVVPTEAVAPGNYLTAEKLAPVVSLIAVPNMDEGLNVCGALLDIDGTGHTAIIHTQSADLVRRFATTIRASRILVNTPATQGLLGLTTGLTASFTLGPGTWGGSSTTNSVTYRDLLNIKRVAYHTIKTI